MSYKKLLQQMIGVILVMLLVVGCGAPAAKLFVSNKQMAVIESLPEDVVCLTSAQNPIESLEGLRDDEFASWVTSPAIPQKLMAAFGREDTPVGLRMMGSAHQDANFVTNHKLRLFITHEPYVEDLLERGGVRIELGAIALISQRRICPG